MKNLLIILLVLFVGCASTPKATELVEVRADEVIKGSEQARRAIKVAESSIEVANQVIPFKNKFNEDIRKLTEEANEYMAEAWKAYESGNFPGAYDYAVKAKITSDKSLEIIRVITENAEEEKRLMAENLIEKAKKQGKDTFEAENYMEQKNYDEALRVIGYVEKKVSVTRSKKVRIVWRDTLWKLAVKYYKDGFQWRKIFKANKNIKNPNKIYPGQVLIIP